MVRQGPGVESVIDSLLPDEQAGLFWCGKSTMDQAVSLTKNIEDCFEAKRKVDAVFVDLTAAEYYDSTWHRGLTCKLLRLLPYKHMIQIIMEVVRNKFTLTTRSGEKCRLQRQEIGIPQGSVLPPPPLI